MHVVSRFCPYLVGKLYENFMAFCQKEQLLFLATCKLYRNAMHCFDGNGYCHACFHFLRQPRICNTSTITFCQHFTLTWLHTHTHTHIGWLLQAHYLDWYIPRHIAGSRALGRSKSAKSAAAKRTEVRCLIIATSGPTDDGILAVSMYSFVYPVTMCHNICIQIASPMHKPEKQAWVTQIIGKICAINFFIIVPWL